MWCTDSPSLASQAAESPPSSHSWSPPQPSYCSNQSSLLPSCSAITKYKKYQSKTKLNKTNCFVLFIYIQICVKTTIMLWVHCVFCQLEARRLFGCCLKYLTEVEERPAASLPSESRETVWSPWLQLFLIPQSCSLLPAPCSSAINQSKYKGTLLSTLVLCNFFFFPEGEMKFKLFSKKFKTYINF